MPKKFDLTKHWATIRDGIIFDLQRLQPEEISEFTLNKGIGELYLKFEIRVKREREKTHV